MKPSAILPLGLAGALGLLFIITACKDIKVVETLKEGKSIYRAD